MTDVDKSEMSPHLGCVWCGKCLHMCTINAVLLKNWFCCDLRCFVTKSVLSRFTHFCVEKNLTKNCLRGEKNDKYQVWPQQPPATWGQIAFSRFSPVCPTHQNLFASSLRCIRHLGILVECKHWSKFLGSDIEKGLKIWGTKLGVGRVPKFLFLRMICVLRGSRFANSSIPR